MQLGKFQRQENCDSEETFLALVFVQLLLLHVLGDLHHGLLEVFWDPKERLSQRTDLLKKVCIVF